MSEDRTDQTYGIEEAADAEPLNYQREAIKALSMQRDGMLLYEFGEQITDLVEAVLQAQKGGSLTVKITVKPGQKGGGRSIVLSDEIKVSKPRRETAETLVYALEGGALTRRDPRQPSLPGIDD